MEKRRKEAPPSSPVSDRAVTTCCEEEVLKRAWRKVDLHIMPVAIILYLASYIDRYNATRIRPRRGGN